MGGHRDPFQVPFLDLARIHEPLRGELVQDIDRLVQTGRFVNGPEVEHFERRFASYCGARHAVGLASGLDALRLGLIGLGVGQGDEVLVPAQTFVATFEAVVQAGAIPVPVDITIDDYGMDPSALAAATTRRTAAIMPVHLYGQLVDMRRIGEVASRSSLAVVEDACQAHGAVRQGARAGTEGSAGAFSFYPGKNLGAFGDAGALVTDDEKLASRVRALREHGQTAKYRHVENGYTARLDTLQALVLGRKLPFLDGWNEARQRVAARYKDALDGLPGLGLPPVAEGSDPVWHLFVVRSAHRDELQEALAAAGVATGIHYPEPPHLTDAFRHLGHPAGSFPVAEALARECLSLPLFPGMHDAEIEQVVNAVRAFHG